eukprot:scaffold254057_cov18-Tisochrysis_lutea.AAC.1
MPWTREQVGLDSLCHQSPLPLFSLHLLAQFPLLAYLHGLSHPVMDPPSTCHPVSPLPSLSALFAQPDWFCWFSPCVPWAVHSGVSDPCGWSLSHFPVEDDLLMCGWFFRDDYVCSNVRFSCAAIPATGLIGSQCNARNQGSQAIASAPLSHCHCLKPNAAITVTLLFGSECTSSNLASRYTPSRVPSQCTRSQHSKQTD